MGYRFRAELWKHTGEAAWHFVTLPIDIADEIEELTASTRHGFGSRRVVVTIGATTWNTSVFPDTASKSYLLPIKKQVRTSERIHEGDLIDVTLELANTSLTTP